MDEDNKELEKLEESRESKRDKENRRKAIFDLINAGGKFRNQDEIVNKLKGKFPNIQQSTVSRDLKEMKIRKDDDGAYCINNDTLQAFRKIELRNLLEKHPPTYYNNVTYHYMKVEKGKASLYAFHLQQVFPEVILDVTIGMDSLLLLINLNAETDEFFNMINNI